MLPGHYRIKGLKVMISDRQAATSQILNRHFLAKLLASRTSTATRENAVGVFDNSVCSDRKEISRINCGVPKDNISTLPMNVTTDVDTYRSINN